MDDEVDEFVDAAQLGIIEDRIEGFEEEYQELQREGRDLERQRMIEEQLKVWKEARDQLLNETG